MKASSIRCFERSGPAALRSSRSTKQLTFELRPTNFISVELFAYTPIPEWNGRKLRIPLEDDTVVTERGVEWLYPVADRIRIVK